MKLGSNFVAILMTAALGLTSTATASATAMSTKQISVTETALKIADKTNTDSVKQDDSLAGLPLCVANRCSRRVSKQQAAPTDTQMASYTGNSRWRMIRGRFWSMW